jgi:hypothetical protein
MSLFHTKLQLVNSTAYRHAPVLRVTDLELSVSAALNQAREATSVQSVETQCNLPRLEFFDTCVGPRPAREVESNSAGNATRSVSRSSRPAERRHQIDPLAGGYGFFATADLK